MVSHIGRVDSKGIGEVFARGNISASVANSGNEALRILSQSVCLADKGITSRLWLLAIFKHCQAQNSNSKSIQLPDFRLSFGFEVRAGALIDQGSCGFPNRQRRDWR
jgi:hypothetical protein